MIQIRKIEGGEIDQQLKIVMIKTLILMTLTMMKMELAVVQMIMIQTMEMLMILMMNDFPIQIHSPITLPLLHNLKVSFNLPNIHDILIYI